MGSIGEKEINKPLIVYRKIKDLLMKNEIVPGQKLQLMDFANKLQVSITPLREALGRLVQEGYVIQLPNKGYYVNAISVKEAEEIFEARQALEMAAIEKVVDLITENDLRELKGNLKLYGQLAKEAASRQRFILDHQFHLKLINIGGNGTIMKLLELILEKLILKRRMEELSQQRGLVAYQEHKALVSSLGRRDKRNSVRNLKRHLEHAKKDFIQSLRRLESI
jgi:DNA-binding GntR family transcriptional regulator